MDPVRGAAGDPHIPPTRYRDILSRKKERPLEPQEKPKFIRDHISIKDITGTRPKELYKGVAKDILNHKDIDGSSPQFHKVSTWIRDII